MKRLWSHWKPFLRCLTGEAKEAKVWGDKKWPAVRKETTKGSTKKKHHDESLGGVLDDITDFIYYWFYITVDDHMGYSCWLTDISNCRW